MKAVLLYECSRLLYEYVGYCTSTGYCMSTVGVGVCFFRSVALHDLYARVRPVGQADGEGEGGGERKGQ